LIYNLLIFYRAALLQASQEEHYALSNTLNFEGAGR